MAAAATAPTFCRRKPYANPPAGGGDGWLDGRCRQCTCDGAASRPRRAQAALSAYAELHPDGDGRVSRSGWVFLLEAVAQRRGLPISRDQLHKLFDAADYSHAGHVSIYEVLSMGSVRSYFAQAP